VSFAAECKLPSFLCSSIVWKEASCVTLPSLRVSRHGLVTPLLDRVEFTTLAVRRKWVICSLLRVGSSAAVTKRGQLRQNIAASRNTRRHETGICMAVPPSLPSGNLLPLNTTGNTVPFG
jgi:hypothetical protein